MADEESARTADVKGWFKRKTNKALTHFGNEAVRAFDVTKCLGSPKRPSWQTVYQGRHSAVGLGRDATEKRSYDHAVFRFALDRG